MKLLFLIFLVVPLTEIYLLIKVGSMIGALLTVFLVVFTAMLGAFLVRAQGFSTLARVQIQVAKGQVPAIEMVEGMFLFIAGALLLTPGFFTDAIGFVFLTPPLRRMIIRTILDKGVLRGFGNFSSKNFSSKPENNTPDDAQSGVIIEGEHKRLD